MGLKLVFVGALVICLSYVVSSEKVVVCYYGTWATYRWGSGQFNTEHINPHLCTHLVYAFVGINSDGTVITMDSYLDLPDGRDNFRKFNALKQQNPNLKTILAVGGWNEGSHKYSVMSASASLRQNFVSSALRMVLDYGFDGFDVDWEYPNQRDTVHGHADVQNFVQVLRELREEFNKHGKLVTAAVASVKNSASLSYDIAAISTYLDFICLMTYDMYGSWDSVTGHNAPLHLGEGDNHAVREDLHTVDVAIEYWLQQGCPREKLVVGLPLYGRSFTLANAHDNGVRAPSIGAGIGGPWTATSGTLGYNEFCSMLRTEPWDRRYDSLAKVPYAVQDRNWVSYDDADSLTRKVEYALANNVAGVMVWSIETDDFHGTCSGENYPLLRAVNRALGRNHESGGSENVPTSPSTTPSTEAPVQVPPPGSICTSAGYAPHPSDCSIFYNCVLGANGEFIAHEFRCAEGLHWDQNNWNCNFADLVNCNK